MVPKEYILKDYVIGDDTQIPFKLTDWPGGITLAKAYFTIKESLDDTDVQAKVQREITGTLTNEGQITADGTTLTAEGYFQIRHEDPEWAGIVPGKVYRFDIQPITNQGRVHTPIDGLISFKKGATLAVS